MLETDTDVLFLDTIDNLDKLSCLCAKGGPLLEADPAMAGRLRQLIAPLKVAIGEAATRKDRRDLDEDRVARLEREKSNPRCERKAGSGARWSRRDGASAVLAPDRQLYWREATGPWLPLGYYPAVAQAEAKLRDMPGPWRWVGWGADPSAGITEFAPATMRVCGETVPVPAG